MHFVQGVTIVLAGSDDERLHAALSLAAANAALGRRSRLFLQGAAVAMLGRADQPGDAERSRHGIPTVPELIGELLAMGGEIIACQSGLALAGMEAGQLPHGIATGGLVEILTTRGDDQLLMA